VGAAARLLEFLPKGKAYRADIVLGVTTDTLDAEGNVTGTADPSAVTREDVEAVLRTLEGEQQQIPPLASAIHHQGRRLYELFREGKQVDVAPRAVWIERLSLVSFENPRVVVDVDCGPGTYVRSLARDLGDRLGCGAHLGGLRRTRSGPFRIEDAAPLDALLESPLLGFDPGGVAFGAPFVAPRTVLAHFPWIVVKPEAAPRVANGCRIGPDEVEILQGLTEAPNCVLATSQGDLLAVAAILPEPDGPIFKPLKVFAASIQRARPQTGGQS